MQPDYHDDHEPESNQEARSSEGARSGRLSALQIAFLVAGIVLALVGGLLSLDSPTEAADASEATPSASPLIRSFADGGGLPTSGSESVENVPKTPESVWGPALLQGGFGAFLGFSLGYASRFFMRFVLVGVGAFFAGVLLMEYAGWVTVEWERIGAAFDQFLAMGEAQLAGLQGFMATRLPTVGLTATGFWVGWRKG